jgi:hypothetical protein
MRVNVYAEEMTTRVELVTKEIPGEGAFTGVRFYLELPVTMRDADHNISGQVAGPFIHREGDDDSSAVTFWGKGKLRLMLQAALKLLEDRDAKDCAPNE